MYELFCITNNIFLFGGDVFQIKFQSKTKLSKTQISKNEIIVLNFLNVF